MGVRSHSAVELGFSRSLYERNSNVKTHGKTCQEDSATCANDSTCQTDAQQETSPGEEGSSAAGPENGGADIEEYGLELNAPHLQLVDLEALGQEPKSVADVVELFEVEVVSDAEDTGQSDEPELTLENSD